MCISIKFNVFGKEVLAVKENEKWVLFYLGPDGKRRPATDLIVPSFLNESEIGNFLNDLCHEWATDRHPEVYRVK